MYPLSPFLNNTGLHKSFATFAAFAFFALSLSGRKAGTMINAVYCQAESTPKATQSLQGKKNISLRRIGLKWGRQHCNSLFFRGPSPGKQCLRDVPESWLVTRTAVKLQQLKMSVAGAEGHFRGGPEEEKETTFRVTPSHWKILLCIDQTKSCMAAKISELFQLRGRKLRSSKAPIQHFLN